MAPLHLFIGFEENFVQSLSVYLGFFWQQKRKAFKSLHDLLSSLDYWTIFICLAIPFRINEKNRYTLRLVSMCLEAGGNFGSFSAWWGQMTCLGEGFALGDWGNWRKLWFKDVGAPLFATLDCFIGITLEGILVSLLNSFLFDIFFANYLIGWEVSWFCFQHPKLFLGCLCQQSLSSHS